MAMEPNRNRIKGRFLPNVIYRSVPGGLTDFLLILGVVLFCTVFSIGEAMMGTVCTLVLSTVGLLVVHRMCIPYNLLHKALIITLILVFAGCIIFVPGLFSLTNVDVGGALVLIVFVLLAWPALKAVTIAEDKLVSAVRGVKAPGKHAGGTKKLRRKK